MDTRTLLKKRELSVDDTIYDESSIQVLEWPKCVRGRIERYLGKDPSCYANRMLEEMMCQALDEVSLGHATKVEVEFSRDVGIRITDDGRGAMIHKAPDGQSVLEVILTTIHAGCGGFRESAFVAQEVCNISLAAVNALSKSFDVDVYRDGYHWHIGYSQGLPRTPLRRLERSERTGTVMHARPDEELLGEASSYDGNRFKDWLKGLSFDYPEHSVRLMS
jgi:DNA gyrase subunit B